MAKRTASLELTSVIHRFDGSQHTWEIEVSADWMTVDLEMVVQSATEEEALAIAERRLGLVLAAAPMIRAPFAAPAEAAEFRLRSRLGSAPHPLGLYSSEET